MTGALGFVASHLIPKLLARADRVLAVVRPGRDASRLERLGCELRRADLEASPFPPGVFVGAHAVVHLAGLALVPGLIGAAEQDGVRRGVFVSSAGVYTRLASASANAKRAGEEALRRSALAWTVLRPSMIYGTPADRNMVRLLRWIDRWPIVPSPMGGVTPQQPVHVDDLVQAILASLDRPAAACRAYDLGGPEALPLREIIRQAAQALGKPAWVWNVPLAPAHVAARWARSLGLPFPVRPEQVLRLAESKAVDIAPARRDLQFEPRPFAEGISAEVRMLRSAPPRGRD